MEILARLVRKERQAMKEGVVDKDRLALLGVKALRVLLVMLETQVRLVKMVVLDLEALLVQMEGRVLMVQQEMKEAKAKMDLQVRQEPKDSRALTDRRDQQVLAENLVKMDHKAEKVRK